MEAARPGPGGLPAAERRQAAAPGGSGSEARGAAAAAAGAGRRSAGMVRGAPGRRRSPAPAGLVDEARRPGDGALRVPA